MRDLVGGLLAKAERASRDQAGSHQGYNFHFHGSLPFCTQPPAFHTSSFPHLAPGFRGVKERLPIDKIWTAVSRRLN
jgi:hypothetical protein